MPDDDHTRLDPKRTALGVGDKRAGTAKPAAELVGEVVNGYFFEAQLGSGAMGSVYRASHVDTQREVAIKVLHLRHLGNARIVERFRREAKLAARLVHPNIAAVLDFSSSLEDGRLLLVLELAPGEPLADVLTMPLPPERVIDLTSQLLSGLDHAHSAGLIHRDLKPENALIAWQGGKELLKIVDFGIAVLRDADEESSVGRLTATGQMVGTPSYMSPEHAKGEAIDHRTDLFALGVIVYEMLAGDMPFSGSALDIALANIATDPPPIEKRVPGLIVDPLLEAFCRKLMARKLDDRFASARAALDVLELITTDREAAELALGGMNVDRALSVVALPDLDQP